MSTLVLILSKLLMTISLVGLLRCSERFRRMSRETDEVAFTALKRIMRFTEESGYPPQLIPLLILLMALSFWISAYVTMAGGR